MPESNDLPPPPSHHCGDILSPGDLPPMYCKYIWDGDEWILEDAHCPAGFYCPNPNTIKVGDPGTHAQPVLYLYPCPDPVSS